MVSLSQFAEVTEEGVLFASPFTGEPTMLTVSNARPLTWFKGLDPCSPQSAQPEQSIGIQHSIGRSVLACPFLSLVLHLTSSLRSVRHTRSDIMMQLDDVVSSLTTGPRVEEAMVSPRVEHAHHVPSLTRPTLKQPSIRLPVPVAVHPLA
jgi:queuine/archaeosine tRNA-ribosyltransferase